MDLKKKVAFGLFWTLTQQFSAQILSFTVSVVLARLLQPSDFGLFGMIAILVGLGNTLMDSGLTSSLIRTSNATQKDYSTVFVLNLVGSIVIYLVVYMIAPLVAEFYNQEGLTDIIRVFCISFIFTAFRGVQSAKLTKEMNFKTQMVIQIPSIVISGILGITLAYYDFGVWSLVWMYLLQSLLSAIQHWFYSGWRPNLLFDKECFKRHFNFGYKITLSGIIVTLYTNIYTIIIAKYFSAAQLGFYTRALSLRQLPISNLAAALNKVTYPMFSAINDDDVKLKKVYKVVMQQVVFWVAPCLIIFIITAEPLIRVLLTEKWMPAVPYFQILCIGGIWLPLQTYNYNIIKVKGKTGLTLRIQIVKKIIGVAGIFLVIPFGIYGLLYFQVFTSMVDYLLDAYFGGNMINYSIFNQAKDFLPTIGIASFSGLIIWLFDLFILKASLQADFARLVVDVALYFAIYLGVSYMFKLSAIFDLKNLLSNK